MTLPKTELFLSTSAENFSAEVEFQGLTHIKFYKTISIQVYNKLYILVFIGKVLLSEGSTTKIEDKQVPGYIDTIDSFQENASKKPGPIPSRTQGHH